MFGLDLKPNFKFMDRMVDETPTTCLLIRDSWLRIILA
ncbi:hypothetical protein [uncultured Carboxylicivirga sp.]